MPRWVRLARNKRYEEALGAARTVGIAHLCRTSGADRLWLLADAARFAGDAGVSRQALVALRERFPKRGLAARAAFLLGRAAFAAQRGDWGASWFGAYLAEAPGGTLATEAAGRIIEAHVGSGRHEAARAAARAYLSRHPKGPHAALARDLIDTSADLNEGERE